MSKEATNKDTEKIGNKAGFFGDQTADFTINKANFSKRNPGILQYQPRECYSSKGQSCSLFRLCYIAAADTNKKQPQKHRRI